jgi:flagellin
MPGYSVLTNPAAASAVLNLNKTLTALNTTQERINTGLKVGKARDDASTFAIALGMRSDIAGFKSVRENLSLGKSTLGVASAAGEQIAEQLKDIKAKVVQASNNSQGRDLIQNSIDNAIEQIKAITAAATFNGINLISGDESNIGKILSVVSSLDRDAVGDLSLGTVDVAYEDLSIEDKDRGLGAVKGLNVTQGKATETRVDREDLVSVEIDLAALAAATTSAQAGESLTLSYIDAEGEEQTLTFEVTSSAGDADNSNFKIDGNGTVDVHGSAADAGSLRHALNNLLMDGGALAGLGFELANPNGTGTTIELRRDEANGAGELLGFGVDPTNTTLDTASAALTKNEAEGGVVQSTLEFNGARRDGVDNATQLAAGDTIDVTFDNGTNQQTFTLVVGDKNEFDPANNGQLINGTSNKYQLSFESAVTKSGGEPITVDDLADEIESLLAGVTVNDFNTAINAHLNDPIDLKVNNPVGFSVEAIDGKVVITDTEQEAAAGNSDTLVGFNMANAPGGSLDFEFMLQQVDSAENHLKEVVGRIGAAEQRIESQAVFIDNLTKAINDGVGTLVDADMSEESARFQALQVQQQLGLQALSIANSQPQSILSLFGG